MHRFGMWLVLCALLATPLRSYATEVGNAKLGVTYDMPDGWTLASKEDDATHPLITSGDEANFSILSMWTEQHEGPLETFSSKNAESLLKGNHEVQESGAFRTDSGVEGRKIVVHLPRDESKQSSREMTIIFYMFKALDPSKVLLFTSVTVKSPKEAGPIYDAILKTLKLKAPKAAS